MNNAPVLPHLELRKTTGASTADVTHNLYYYKTLDNLSYLPNEMDFLTSIPALSEMFPPERTFGSKEQIKLLGTAALQSLGTEGIKEIKHKVFLILAALN